jgi:hypothetical protein
LTDKPKEQIEQRILELLSRYRSSGGDSMESERHKVLLKLVEAVWQWYEYSSVPVRVRKRIKVLEQGKKSGEKEQREDMGLEIFYAVKSCANRPYKGSDFFAALKTAIEHEKTNSYYKEEADLSKYYEGTIRKFKKLIEYKEESENRIMPEGEKIEYVSRFCGISLEKAAKYFELDRLRSKAENIAIYDDDEEKDLFDTIESPDYSSFLGLDNKWFAENAPLILRDIEAVINEKQKTRECRKELFTLRYVDKLTELIESSGPLSFASDEIIQAKANGEKLPAPYEIWQKYHPETAKLSADASASRALAELEESLRIKLRESRKEYLFQKN